MRTIKDQECLFLVGLIHFPRIIFLYSDLNFTDFSSEFPWFCYEALLGADVQHLDKYGFYYLLSDLRKKEKLMYDEFVFAADNFNILLPSINEVNVDMAYKLIIEDRLEKKYINNLSPILNNLNLKFKEKIESVLDITEKINDNLIEPEEITPLPTINMSEEIESVLSFGIKRLDSAIKVNKNWLIIIASRPFNGKTSFACKIAMENTRKGKVLYYSLEMTKEDIAEKVKEYGDFYKANNFLIIEKTQVYLNQLIKTAKKIKPQCIVIDQFNKIVSSGNTEYERFTNTARKLKIVAGILEIPIIVLAQINRSAEDKPPHSFQMKGSGSLEEEADLNILLHVTKRTQFKHNSEKQELGEGIFIVTKNRTKYGLIGDVFFSYDSGNNFFYEKGG